MNEKQYYYLNGTMKMGPFSFEALQKAPIKPDTLVWNKTLPDWVEARSLPEFQAFFASLYTKFEAPNTPPPIHQSSGSTYSNPVNSTNFGGNTFSNYSHFNTPMPDSHMVWAILSTVFCCWPLGIVSIVNASKVSTAYASGDYTGSFKASEDAKKWAIWSAVSALIVCILYFLFFVIVGIAA